MRSRQDKYEAIGQALLELAAQDDPELIEAFCVAAERDIHHLPVSVLQRLVAMLEKLVQQREARHDEQL